MTDLNTTALHSLVSLAGLVVLIFWLYRDYCVDFYRQRMFELRDSLFDEARAGNIRFDDEAYLLLRRQLNRMIRFGHRISLLHLILYLNEFDGEEVPTQFRGRLTGAINSLDDAKKTIYADHVQKMGILTTRHLMMGSPILLMTVFVPIACLVLTTWYARKAILVMRKPLEQLDVAASAYDDCQSHRDLAA